MKRFQLRVVVIAAVVGVITLLPNPFHRPAPTPRIEPPRPFTIIVLPDTQYYAMFFPEIFSLQTEWIVQQQKARNIVFVSQEGDIVNIPDAEYQWQVASAALAKLDGIVPYGIAPGNHDFSSGGYAPLYQKYFPMSRLMRSPAWGGSYLEMNAGQHPASFNNYDKNSYQLFNGGGVQYIAFNLELCPPDPVIDWVGLMLTLHADRQAIITTHSFTDFTGQRTGSDVCSSYGGEGDNAGQAIWKQLVLEKHHLNILMFLSGHDITATHGAARRTDMVDGHPIHQILANYQQLERGGNGYLRIMTFRPSEHKIQVETYSPYLNKYVTDTDNHFNLKL